ncbi:outer membrane receptor protein involved in Fe transport [Chitinophaga skermanii]|uniref:Outer membrane receptor protein involved in Fe transport n=1 Tax=Chitinophaga skermanii TaxID=331697 RepID=A0A327R1Q4_9BACT|nr:TonB-dependent receptor [Chitinophaga skermanii]RAJ10590.1 outer membrane receptor protein involved in Fe transport [Chitinophaga skermanii]
MRLRAFFSWLVVWMCSFSIAIQAQTMLSRKVTVDYANSSLESVLIDIQQRYQIPFSYISQNIPLKKVVNLRAREESLQVVLGRLFSSTDVTWKEVSSQILLVKTEAYTQAIVGVVTDKNMRTPIPGVTIFLQSQPNIGTVSNGEGQFKLNNIPLGRQDITVRCIGYKPVTLPAVLFMAGKQTMLNVSLEEDVITAKEFMIRGTQVEKDKTINPLAIVSARMLSVEEANRFAGTRSDPSRMASNYAGVTNMNDLNNDIIVRGNNSFGMLWRLEGVDIPNPNHYTYINTSGGVFSVLNNNLIANSDFITSAMPAEYGNKISSAFDIRLRTGNNLKHEFNGQIGLSGIEFNAEGPLDKAQGSSYLIGARMLNFDFIKKFGVDLTVDGVPRFNDITFKLNFPGKFNDKFVVFGMGGKSKVLFEDEEKDMSQLSHPLVKTYGFFRSDVGVLGMRYEHYYSPKTYGQVITSFSTSAITSTRDINQPGKETLREYVGDFKEKGLTMSYQLTHKADQKNLVKSGITFSRKSYNYYLRNLQDKNIPLYSLNIDQLAMVNLLQGFVHWQYKPIPKLTFNTGLHYQQLFYNRTQGLDPRFSAEYAFNTRSKLKLGYGLHHQAQPVYMYINRNYNKESQVYTPANRDLKFSASNHYVVGYDYSFSKYWRFKTETYFQQHFNIPISASPGFYSALNDGAGYNEYVPDTLVNKGKGENYGIEFTIEKFLHKNTYFLFTTSLYNAHYLAPNGKWYNTLYNGNYIVNLAGGWEYPLGYKKKNALSVDLRILQSGNRRDLPIDVEASRAKNELVIKDDGFYEHRYKDYSRVDIKVSYRLNRPHVSHHFFIAIDNLLNTRNEFGNVYYYYEREQHTAYQMGMFPYGGYKVLF